MIYHRIFALAIFASLLVATAAAQSVKGTYRGMFVCEKMKASPDILHVPLDLAIRGDSVQAARPLFNWNGTRVLGSELGSGTIDSDGKLHMTSNCTIGGVSYQGDYSGTLTAKGGTFTGTQSWHDAQGNEGSRTCTAALVPAPKSSDESAQQ
jgi:hypothetical protein